MMDEPTTATSAEILAAHVDAHVGLAAAMAELVPQVVELARELVDVFASGGRLYTFGNGGSAADAQHLAAELVGRYGRDRRPLPAMSMVTDPSVVSCIGNDYSFDDVFARQVTAFATSSDMVIGFTTSGRSPNVVNGLAAARRTGARAVVLCGAEGAAAAAEADVAILVPSTETPRIQEMHLLTLHLLSELVDRWAANDAPLESTR